MVWKLLSLIFFSGLEKAVYWIKKKIFQETDFDDNMKRKKSEMNYYTSSDFFYTFVRLLERNFREKVQSVQKNMSVNWSVR